MEQEHDDHLPERIIEVVNPVQFVVLFVASFGLYVTWWQYKTWRLIQQREGLDIWPAVRALFAIIFLYPLFEHIRKMAADKGYEKDYPSIALFLGYFLLVLCSRFSTEMMFVAFLGVGAFLPPLQAFNYALEHTPGYRVVRQTQFSGRQLALIFFGAMFWAMVIMQMLEMAPFDQMPAE